MALNDKLDAAKAAFDKDKDGKVSLKEGMDYLKEKAVELKDIAADALDESKYADAAVQAQVTASLAKVKAKDAAKKAQAKAQDVAEKIHNAYVDAEEALKGVVDSYKKSGKN